MLTWVKIIIVLPFVIFLFIFLLLMRNTFIPRYPELGTPRDYGMDFKEVDFLSTDKVRLKGWLIVKDKMHPLIILCHGLGTNKSDCLEFAKILYLSGYNIFMFDFRGHGKSQGLITSFGYKEQRDLSGAVEYLKTAGFKELGIFGISMGGSVAIMVAAQNPELKAIVADSPYVDLDETIITHTKMVLGIPLGFLGRLAILAYRLRFLVDSSQVSPIKVISRISPRSVLIINGADDERMNSRDAERLFTKASDPKDLWLVPGAGHLESLSADGNEYNKRVINFFNKAFYHGK